MNMDVTIVCGRRPDLLAKTIKSFKANLFDNFNLGTVYANIDPFCGTGIDGKECEDILKNAFSSVAISRPKTPSFGLAVKNLWSKPKSKYFFHLEDDWEIIYPVVPSDVEQKLSSTVVQLQLSKLKKPYLPHKYSYEVNWINILGMKFIKRTNLYRPLFTTSPSFIDRDFALECSSRIDPDKDPEKQLFKADTQLGEFTATYRNWPITGPGKDAMVRDLGRDWLAERGIKKQINDGVSRWIGL